MTTRHDPLPRSTPAPLNGLRVVELSSYVAAPLCGLSLAALGAEVIRVEPLGGAPDRRRWPLADNDTSLYWNGLNGGKKAIEIDLKQARGRQLVADLITGSGPDGGIVVTNTDRWPELTYESLRRRRPDVIHVRLTGRADGSPAVDYTVQAETGLPQVTGAAEQAGVVNHVLPAWDIAAGLYMATGLLAALLQRRESGTGGQVQVALHDVAMATIGQLGYLAEAQLHPRHRRRPDGNFVYGTFGNDFVSADGPRFMLVALTSRQWADLITATGLGDAIAGLSSSLRLDLSDEGTRYRCRHLLADLIATWFSQHDASDVEAALRPTSVLWSRYLSFSQLTENGARELLRNPMFEAIDQPGVGSLIGPGSPISVSSWRGKAAPAPLVGEHTCRVLDAAGMSSDEIARLTDKGVIRATPAPGARR